jgi:hypothetical protein
MCCLRYPLESKWIWRESIWMKESENEDNPKHEVQKIWMIFKSVRQGAISNQEVSETGDMGDSGLNNGALSTQEVGEAQ